MEDSFGFVISLLLGRAVRSTFIVQDTSGFVEAISFIHFVLSFFLQFDGPLRELWPWFDLTKFSESIRYASRPQPALAKGKM